MATFALLKTVIVVLLLLISYYYFGKYGWVIPAILTVVGVYLVVNNLVAFLQAAAPFN